MGGVRRPIDEEIKRKIKLLNLAELGNVSRACKEMRVSRDTYYRLRKLYKQHGRDGLLAKRRVKRDVEVAILALTREEPEWGKARVAWELEKRSRGRVKVGPTGVRGVWLRHNLTTRKARLAAAPAAVRKKVKRRKAKAAAARGRPSKDRDAVPRQRGPPAPSLKGRMSHLPSDRELDEAVKRAGVLP